jgi:hypothetical protein
VTTELRETNHNLFRRKAAALARVLPTFPSTPKRTPHGGSGKVPCWFAQADLLKMQKRGKFPDELVRIEVVQIHYVVSQMY